MTPPAPAPPASLLSIIVPIYNRADMLPDILESVRAQPYRPVELILIDDGSTDNPAGALETWQRELGVPETGITIRFCGQDNQGAPSARNKGVRESSGAFVQFMDSDDVLAEDGPGPLVEALRNDPAADLAFGNVKTADLTPTGTRITGRIGHALSGTPRDVTDYNWHTMGAVYRRSFLEKVGPWNEELSGSQDWEFGARVKMLQPRTCYEPVTVGYFRQHDGARVGTGRFRPDYVRSTGLACLAISSSLPPGLPGRGRVRCRLLRRMFVHMLEARAAGARPTLNDLNHSLKQFGFPYSAVSPVLVSVLKLIPRRLALAAWKSCTRRLRSSAS